MASSKKNKFLRLIHIVAIIVTNFRKSRVVLIDTYSTTAFWYAYFAAKVCFFLKIPYVPILHGGMLANKYKQTPKKFEWFLNHADNMVCPSMYLSAFFTAQGFKNIFIPNFIEIDRYRFMERTLMRPKILWVRAFHDIYNPIMAVEMMNLLVAKYHDAHLCMVGGVLDEELFKRIKKTVNEHGLNDSICFTGILKKEDWAQLSEEFSIFVNTTNIDNMPVSVVESMALGLPVVSTNVGGLPFLIQDGTDGMLVAANDPNGMATAITTLIENPEFAWGMAHAARRKVEGFDWHLIRIQWSTLLDPYLQER